MYNTFFGGNKLPVLHVGQHAFTGWASGAAGKSLDWLQAAIPGLGGALAQHTWVLVGGFLHQLGCGKEHTAQKGEEEIAGWLCQGIGGAFCILGCCTKLGCLIKVLR